MTNALHAADGSPEEPLPATTPDDSEQPDRPKPSPGAPQVHIERLKARIETLVHERNLWRARAHENSLALDRQKLRITELERNHR